MCWSMSERWDQSDISLTPQAQPSRLDRAAADILGYVAAADILGYVAAPDMLGYVAAADILGYVAAADILGYVAASDILGYVAAPDILGYVAAVLALHPVVSGGILVETELPALGLREETKHHVTLSPAE